MSTSPNGIGSRALATMLSLLNFACSAMNSLLMREGHCPHHMQRCSLANCATWLINAEPRRRAAQNLKDLFEEDDPLLTFLRLRDMKLSQSANRESSCVVFHRRQTRRP